jgi:hypothetical protein
VDLERQPGSNVVPKLAIGRTIKRQPSIAISANQVADDDDDDDNDDDDDDNDDGDDAVMREQSIFCNIDFPGPGFHLPSLFLGARGAEKGAHNPDRRPATMPGVSSTYPEVQPGCTGCRVHPGCTKVIATIIDQDVEYSRGAEHEARKSASHNMRSKGNTTTEQVIHSGPAV